MRISLISLIDKFSIASIYIILVMDFPLLVKLFFAVTLFLIVFVILHNKELDKKAIVYILFIFSMFSILALVGVLKANELTDILKFIFPIFTLLNIFVYIELVKIYSIERYVYHIYIASILVSLKILLLFILFTNNILIDYLPIYDPEKVQSTWIGFNAGSLRIFIGQATIIPIGLLLHQVFYKKVPYVLLTISFIALFLTQATVLWVIYFLVLIYIIHLNFKSIYKYIYLLLSIACIILLIFEYYDMLSLIIEEKLLYSVPVKLQQIDIATNMINENLFFGGGLGYIFSNGANAIEVVIFHVLTTTGLVGFLIYTYMLFYWSILSLKYIKIDKLIKFLILSYFTIVFASFSNSYLLGGSSGLFLIPFIVARFIDIQNKKASACVS